MTGTEQEPFRSGFVGVAGVPNVGKSTLVNRLVGQKVTIASSAPQTTRHRICGIVTEEKMQAVLVDVPGILRTDDRFNQGLVECAEAALGGCDIVLFLRAAESAGTEDEERAIEIIGASGKPVWEVWNKMDRKRRRTDGPAGAPKIRVERSFRVSAKTGMGLVALKAAIAEGLPPGPLLYPADEVSDRDLRFLCAELVREQLFRFLHQEVPYGVATWTDTWREDGQGLIHLRVVIQTERKAHKPIILGAGGSMLKRVGSAARREIELLCDARVYLELWVQVRPRWRRDEIELLRLNLPVKR